MEKIISLKERLKKISLFLDTIENEDLSRIGRDILLQKIRDFYDLALNIENASSENVNKTEQIPAQQIKNKEVVNEFKPVANDKAQIVTKSEPVIVEFKKENEPIIYKEIIPEPVYIAPEKDEETPIQAVSKPDEFVVEFADSFDEEPQFVNASEIIPEVETKPVVEPVIAKQETVINQPVVEPVIVKQETVIKQPVVEQATLFKDPPATGVKTLGEQLGQNKTSLNEMLANKNTGADVSARLKPISDIKSAIGVGDRFLFIRELFAGSNDLFDETISHLNSLQSFDDAQNFLFSKFNWDKTNTTVSGFINIVKRRYA